MEQPTIEILAESERFNLIRTLEPDGETTYHLELGNVTVHFFREEWEELVQAICNVERHAAAR